jgi:hypothetical protein
VETTADISADLQAILKKAGLAFQQDIDKGWTLKDYNAI